MDLGVDKPAPLDGSLRSQLILVGLCLPGGAGLLWLAGSTVLHMLSGMLKLDPVVIVDRLALAGCGAGLGMLGAALVVISGDFLRSRRLTQASFAILLTGGLLTVLLPLPASLAASGYLARSGYITCRELTEPSFKLSRTAWVRSADACARPG